MHCWGCPCLHVSLAPLASAVLAPGVGSAACRAPLRAQCAAIEARCMRPCLARRPVCVGTGCCLDDNNTLENCTLYGHPNGPVDL